MARFVQALMALTLADGSRLAAGAHQVGEDLSEADADSILGNPRWAREISEDEANALGRRLPVDPFKIPGNRFAPPVEGAAAATPVPVPAGNDTSGADGEAPTLAATNPELKGHLESLDAEGRAAFWTEFDEDELNAFLVDRFGEEAKERSHGTAVNMIEKRLGATAA